jgi:hypothetical protein
MAMEWVPGNPNDRSIEGFCIRHGRARGPMSRKKYNKMRAAGHGPRETIDVDGMIMILPKDEAAWEEARRNPDITEQRLIEKVKEFRRQRARKAGRASAASARHVSKRGPRKKR